MPDTCPKCNHPIQAGSQFCDNCGEKVSSAPPVVPAWMNPVPPTLPKKPQIPQNPKPAASTTGPTPIRAAETPPVAPRISAVSGRILVQSSGSSIPIPPEKLRFFSAVMIQPITASPTSTLTLIRDWKMASAVVTPAWFVKTARSSLKTWDRSTAPICTTSASAPK